MGSADIVRCCVSDPAGEVLALDFRKGRPDHIGLKLEESGFVTE